MTAEEHLQTKIDQIKRVFDIDTFLKLQPDQTYVQSYYKESKAAYTWFYRSAADRMYMGISRDGIYKEADLLEAARLVEKWIKNKNAQNVLELATGRGATSAYLASRHPNTKFYGLDLSSAQLDRAKKKAASLTNYRPIMGDYHDLSNYSNKSMDIVYVIEALCYSDNKEQVFKEVNRVLKKDGVFIIFDGYNHKNRAKMTGGELLACTLTEKSMALSVFEDYESVIRKAKRVGFYLISSEDVSKFIIPTQKRFERYARLYFDKPRLAKIINMLTPEKMMYNSVAGLLMPDVVGYGLLSYYITVLKSK